MSPAKAVKKKAGRRKGVRRNGASNGNGKVPELVEQPHGGALLSGGVPGNRGGVGRPPNRVIAALGDLMDHDRVVEVVTAALTSLQAIPCPHCKKDVKIPVPRNSDWRAFLELALDRTVGRVPQSVNVGGGLDNQLEIKVTREYVCKCGHDPTTCRAPVPAVARPTPRGANT